jgi:hypothetical protein
VSFPTVPGEYVARPQYAELLRHVGLATGRAVLEHPGVRVWRSIRERENCTLDATRPDGSPVRLHIKRVRRGNSDVLAEVRGLQLLDQAGIGTTPLVAHGWLAGGPSFLITEDLAGYSAADQLVRDGVPFQSLLEPTAALAARLHAAGLHHRDLYLCHFFARVQDGRVDDVRLIDAARVRPLPRLFRQRWVVKDLAQFWYSTQSLPATDVQREQWLSVYAEQAKLTNAASLRRKILAKSAWIARHDAALRRRQPERDVTLGH